MFYPHCESELELISQINRNKLYTCCYALSPPRVRHDRRARHACSHVSVSARTMNDYWQLCQNLPTQQQVEYDYKDDLTTSYYFEPVQMYY